ncbi:MAG: DNA methyltransferase [Paludibacter sp.]|nr:DNA methyltransferase [Paludibacter sp.]
MNLDFSQSNTRLLTHGFHKYPAKMVPQIASALISEFGANASLLFDPYCGTGTSLVEANVRGVDSIGSDLNPLAILISKVKTTPIELQTLELHLNDFYKYLFPFRYHLNPKDYIVVNFPRIDFWFSKEVKNKLSIIKDYVNSIENIDIKDFFKIAFSHTIRECSFTRNNEFKLYKMSEDQIKSFNPEPFGIMEEILGMNYLGLKSFIEERKNAKTTSLIYDFNTIDNIPQSIIIDKSIDIVVTSPPYGDSSTTVAYGQFSALSNQWLDLMENGRSLDKNLMGGSRITDLPNFESKVLNKDIEAVKKIDDKRALDVISFYSDYEKSIKNISTVIKPNGYACYVVSNRNVKGNILHTDEITKDFFQQCGFNHINTFYRKISNKRLPRYNSPKGEIGSRAELMNTESIIIMQKQ